MPSAGCVLVLEIFTQGEKRLQIAFATHKRPIEANFLRGYFGARFGEYAHVPWVPLVQTSCADCARAMGQSAAHAALPLLESLGLMNLEAMASGCHVVGYTGHGGAEYATPQNGDWIADGDHDAFVEKLRDACKLYESRQANRRSQQAAQQRRNSPAPGLNPNRRHGGDPRPDRARPDRTDLELCPAAARRRRRRQPPSPASTRWVRPPRP